MKVQDNHILIIFGASGDLTKRKLIPGLFALEKQKWLPDKFAVLGIGRTDISNEQFRERMIPELEEEAQETGEKEFIPSFLQRLHYLSLQTQDTNDYVRLKEKFGELDKAAGGTGNAIFYLATPPSLYEIIPMGLHQQGLSGNQGNGWKRLIVEKPFGYDLASAKHLNKKLLEYFKEDQIYRIDHYLGKETVQNVMVTRFSNGIFEPLWNRNYIHHVEITAAESIGVENRGGYYDKSGALRDMVQNHLLQLVGLVAMEPPTVINSHAIRNETLKIFQSLRKYRPKEVATHVIRGQYTDATIRGEKARSYRNEKGVTPDSRTETYVALKLYIDNWRWGGVPFYIRTGKRLPTRVTEIVIHFKPTPHKLFCFDETRSNSDNQLVIRIQPDEGILFKFGMKIPGAGFRVQDVNMDFHYSELAEGELPEAYQRLLLDCMQGDSTLYARGDAVEEAWDFIDPILRTWENNPEIQIYGYPAGTWGPEQADDLIDDPRMTWRYPCKNLSNDGIFCEL